MSCRAISRTFVAAAALAWASLFQLAQAQPYVHPPTRLVFPDQIAGLPRGNVQDYEAQHPGLGVSVRYELPRQVRADVYLYTAGLTQVPAELTHPTMVQLRRQTDLEILAFPKTQGGEIRKGESATLQVETAKGIVPVFYDRYHVLYPSGPLASYVWLWSARNHILKVRITRPDDDPEPRVVQAFVEAVVRLTAE